MTTIMTTTIMTTTIMTTFGTFFTHPTGIQEEEGGSHCQRQWQG